MKTQIINYDYYIKNILSSLDETKVCCKNKLTKRIENASFDDLVSQIPIRY